MPTPEEDGSDELPTTPGPNAGGINPATLEARAPLALSEDQRRLARDLRVDLNWSFEQIADTLGCSVAEVQHALATLRTPSENPQRGTLNVSLAALAYFRSQQLPGEAMWETVNRLTGIE